MSLKENLRFPSGVTVAQAKKDAKAIAKSQALALSEAQYLVSRRNGLDMPWGKAMTWLVENDDRVASFTMPLLTPQSHIIDVPSYAPVIAILGGSGCGKSVLSAELAKQHLTNHSTAKIYWASPIGRRPTQPADASRSRHMPEHILEKLETTFPGRVEFKPYDPERVFADVDAPAGSMIVLDDLPLAPSFHNDFPTMIKAALAQRLVLVIIGQTPADLFRDDIPEELGLLIIGRTTYMSSSFRKYPSIEQWDNVLKDLPNYGEFLVAPVMGNWAGLIRLPTPKF